MQNIIAYDNDFHTSFQIHEYGGYDSHVDMGFVRMKSSVPMIYDVIRSDEVHPFVNKPEK